MENNTNQQNNEPKNDKSNLGRFIIAPHYIYLKAKRSLLIIEIYEKVEFITHPKLKDKFYLEDLILPLN